MHVNNVVFIIMALRHVQSRLLEYLKYFWVVDVLFHGLHVRRRAGGADFVLYLGQIQNSCKSTNKFRPKYTIIFCSYSSAVVGAFVPSVFLLGGRRVQEDVVGGDLHHVLGQASREVGN